MADTINFLNLTKFAPLRVIDEIIEAKLIELRNKCPALRALWTHDKENMTVYICTNYPGYWIGRAGEDADRLRNDINAAIKFHNENHPDNQLGSMKVNFIECMG